MKSTIDLKKMINEKRKKLIEEKGKLKAIETQLQTKINEQSELKEESERALTIKGLVEKSASEARQNGTELLQQVMSASLQTVFGDNTEAKLKMDLKDGIPSLSISTLKHVDDGTITIDPTEADGGGLADIVALASFMGIGQFVEDNHAPYVLDEPTKYVSEGDKATNSAQFVKNMVSFTGKQTIVSTHDKALMEQRDNGYKLIMDETTGITSAYEDTKL